jgi:hypothetical protein
MQAPEVGNCATSIASCAGEASSHTCSADMISADFSKRNQVDWWTGIMSEARPNLLQTE